MNQGATLERYASRIDYRGYCLLHGQRADTRPGGVCDECRVQNELTEGDYLREFGVLIESRFSR